MALDRQKALKSAEALLSGGKVQAAVVELQRLAARAPNDLLSLNRIGDMLARAGQNEEAIRFYAQIAEQFTQQGFYPKAIAIYKKILRLDAQNPEAMIWLGDLYVKQKLPGEARSYLLFAAEAYLQRKEFALAREVFERMVAAEPSDPRHRARLAEARAAEGDAEAAGRELVDLGASLFDSGSPGDAEQAYQRARELLPDAPEPLLGIARCMGETGRGAEGLELLEQVAAGDASPPGVIGELILRYETEGRESEADEWLRRPASADIDDEAMRRLFELQMGRGKGEQLWNRMDAVLAAWCKGGRRDRVLSLLEELGGLEERGHLPALKRLYEQQKDGGEQPALLHSMERLARAYSDHSMTEEASSILGELRKLRPEPAKTATSEAPEPSEAPEAEPGGQATRAEPAAEIELPLRVAAPAVPLNPADEEFVTGRLTQAEILEKYGLEEKALEQLEEITERFPGHVVAQQSRVMLLRAAGAPAALRDAYVGLALARRASGDTSGARDAAHDAGTHHPLDETTEAMLIQLGLLDRPTQAVPAPASAPASDEAILIDLDDLDDDEEEAETDPQSVEKVAVAETVGPPEVKPAEVAPSTPAAVGETPTVAEPAAASGPRVPGQDMLEEIALHLDRQNVDEARRRVDALRTLGYGGTELDELAARVEQASPPETQSLDIPTEEVALEDDDLLAITSALESELFADDEAPPPPNAESEQSLGEVFAAFREHVEQEVGSEDFQTHYDLGIGYKEMGLVDEAIHEFETAVKSPEIFREACVMLAVCTRERGDMDAAANWYRRALSADEMDPQATAGLRYELAEVLLLSGDRQGALELFRNVLQADPMFRDVRERVADLESPSRT